MLEHCFLYVIPENLEEYHVFIFDISILECNKRKNIYIFTDQYENYT